jgi:hypothetical protein
MWGIPGLEREHDPGFPERQHATRLYQQKRTDSCGRIPVNATLHEFIGRIDARDSEASAPEMTCGGRPSRGTVSPGGEDKPSDLVVAQAFLKKEIRNRLGG